MSVRVWAAALLVAGCGRADSVAADAGAPPPAPAPTAEIADAGVDAPAPARGMVVLAGGDVSFGRVIGQMLLKDPDLALLAPVAPYFATADVRFVNLEGPLTDQHGETEREDNHLVFCGPPAGAAVLGKAGVTVVSLANNHAWDYGKPALFETMDLLDRAGVQYVGAGRDHAASVKPAIVEHAGFRLAFLAATDIWNQGVLSRHPAAEFVVRADPGEVAASVRALRGDPTIDAIAVSYHGGVEYTFEPLPRTREFAHAMIDAGADVVIGHHVHVVQGIEWYRGKPILYSLGNLLMRMHSNHAWTGMAYLARLTLAPDAPPTLEACPFRIHGIEPLPFADRADRASYERQFFDHLRLVSKATGGIDLGAPGDDGCAAVRAPAPAPAPAPTK